MGITGQGSAIQIGLGKVWSVSVAPVVSLSHQSESMKLVPEYSEEESLVGGVTTSRLDIQGKKIEGDISCYAKPDYIAYCIALALGVEADPELVDGSTGAYRHIFTPLPGGALNSLLSASILVNRHVAVKEYVSCKMESLSLSASVKDYLQMTMTFKGHSEIPGTLSPLSQSVLPAYKFKEGTVKTDSVPLAKVTSFKFDYGNALESDLYTMDSGEHMDEIEPQKREITAELEVLYDSQNEALRESKFVQGNSVALEVVFTSSSEIESGFPYELKIEVPLGFVKDASPVLSGSERIKQTLSIKATGTSNDAVTITVTDGKDTKYIS